MNRRKLIKCLTLVTLTGGTSIFGISHAGAEVIPATRRPGMKIGDSLQYDDGLKLTFVKVRRDARQPQGIEGAKMGSATVVLRAEFNDLSGKNPPRTYILKTGDNFSSVAIPSWPPGLIGFKTYQVRLDSLTPRPKAVRTLKPSDYRLQLSISVAY